jgi:hypothetical protein
MVMAGTHSLFLNPASMMGDLIANKVKGVIQNQTLRAGKVVGDEGLSKESRLSMKLARDVLLRQDTNFKKTLSIIEDYAKTVGDRVRNDQEKMRVALSDQIAAKTKEVTNKAQEQGVSPEKLEKMVAKTVGPLQKKLEALTEEAAKKKTDDSLRAVGANKAIEELLTLVKTQERVRRGEDIGAPEMAKFLEAMQKSAERISNLHDADPEAAKLQAKGQGGQTLTDMLRQEKEKDLMTREALEKFERKMEDLLGDDFRAKLRESTKQIAEGWRSDLFRVFTNFLGPLGPIANYLGDILGVDEKLGLGWEWMKRKMGVKNELFFHCTPSILYLRATLSPVSTWFLVT